MLTGDTDHQQQIRTQLQAHNTLGELLIRQFRDSDLARHPMHWTVTPGMLHGEPAARGDTARQAAIVAWAEVVELTVEKTAAHGRPAQLTAKGPYTPVGGDPIRVNLVATLNGTDEDTGGEGPGS